jgi:hypothetical protein
VPIPEITAPKFISQQWLSAVVHIACENFAAQDADEQRVPPMAFIRCSRGGKTRALKEVANALKSKFSDAAIIFVAFNGFSSVQEWEQKDPLGALCRRVAFAAMKGRDFNDCHQFNNSYQHMDVQPNQILDWLKGTRRVLLIDGLNALTHINAPFNEFLRDNFLNCSGQYHIFSSHAHRMALNGYMPDIQSARSVSVHTLPLISTVKEACDAFGGADNITPTKVLFYGKIPAMLYLAGLGFLATMAPYAIKACQEGGLVTDDSVRNLMSSFLTGRANEVMKPLLSLMDSQQDEKVRWIPYHMILVLEFLAKSVQCSISKPLKDFLEPICKLMESLNSAISNDGTMVTF